MGIMAKVGPSQAYAGTAKAAMSFPLKPKLRAALKELNAEVTEHGPCDKLVDKVDPSPADMDNHWKKRQSGDTPKQTAEPERKRDRSAEILGIPSQAEAAASIGNAVPLYEFVPPKASISTARQVGNVKN